MAKKPKGHPPSFPMYANDFASSATVEAMSTQAVGAYILLLCKAWHQEPVGTIPDNHDILSKWARVSRREWDKMSESVLSAFVLVDGRYHQTRMQDEYSKVLEYRDEREKSGKAGAEKRWQKDRSAIDQLSQTDGYTHANSIAKNASSSSYSSSSSGNEYIPPPPREESPESDDGVEIGDAAFQYAPSEGFRRFFGAYPRKLAPADAWKTWQGTLSVLMQQRGLPDAKIEEFLIDRAEVYATTPSGTAPPPGCDDFRPSPAKWLKDGKYDEPYAEWQTPNGKGLKNGKHGGAGGQQSKSRGQVPDSVKRKVDFNAIVEKSITGRVAQDAPGTVQGS